MPSSTDASVPPYAPRSLDIGGWRITELSDGLMRLDGGAMWGVVPRALWHGMTPPAADNTIAIALRPFLAQRAGVNVVVEVGAGQRWDAKARHMYAFQSPTTLAQSLRACGLEPADITHVVASHCHWDHIGGALVEREGGLEPLFSRARHFAPRIEIEMAKKPGHARKGSYRASDVEPLERSGLLESYDGDVELAPGLHAHVLGGHSDGVSVITLGDERASDCAIFWSDVVPTTHHVQPPYIMAYDIDVVRSFEQRSTWLARACERGWLGLFYHDVEHAFGRVVRDGKRYAVVTG